MQNAEAIFHKWNQDMDQLHDQIVFLAHMDNVFWQVIAIILANPEITQQSDVFPEWIRDAYIHTICAGLRRLVDKRKDTVSLRRLLEDMQHNDNLLTRSRYLSMRRGPMTHFAKRGFDDLAGKDSVSVSKNRIGSLIRELDEAFRAVSEYANRHVTHLAKQRCPTDVKFQDARQALATAFQVYSWCLRLVRADSMHSPVPVIQDNWLQSFRIPWLRESDPIPDYEHLDKLLNDKV